MCASDLTASQHQLASLHHTNFARTERHNSHHNSHHHSPTDIPPTALTALTESTARRHVGMGPSPLSRHPKGKIPHCTDTRLRRFEPSSSAPFLAWTGNAQISWRKRGRLVLCRMSGSHSFLNNRIATRAFHSEI